ncbi:MAG: ATP-binding cassette domain-containing protein [Chloroflexi bacterium]|nr:ATP-binding cassette domain-containing protein [Chloroflexota bacterium]
MLRLRHVWRTYPVGESEVVALRDVSLDIHDGDFMAIVGPSGSGKSTLLQIVGLLDLPTRGVVELDGRDVAEIGDDERTRLRLTTLGFVFQRFHLLSDLTAIENVAVPLEAAGVPPRERFERAAWLLKAVGLGERLDFKPARLSGGQRQRVAIARALANRPRIILADEPTGELHSEDKAQVIALFRQLNQEGCAVVMVTHDREVAEVARRRIEIRDGEVRETTPGASPIPTSDPSPAPLQAPSPQEGRIVGSALAPARPVKRRRWPWLVLGLLLVAGLAGGGLAYWTGLLGVPMPATVTGPVATPAVQRVTARGEIRPVAEARIGTLSGGVVNRLAVQVGQSVDEGQEVARIVSPSNIEVLVAPWRGTIADIPVHVGDTVTPGTTVVLIADLSRLQVETTDVDEFIIANIHSGQTAAVTVDALDQRQIRATVRSASLQPRRSVDGDENYAVILDLEWTPPELRAGMSVRIAFDT